MKGWVAAGAAASALAAGGYAVRKGLKRLPPPFEVTASTPPLVSQPIPELPAPVRRYLETVAPDMPVMTSAVITGRMTMVVGPMTLPGRWRFVHDVARGYRHEMEVVVLGRRVMTGLETYIDGHARLDLPGGVVEDEPKVDRSALQTMWAEYLWLPSVLASAKWEAIDDECARLWMPGCEQPFLAWFDGESGLLSRLETLRFREATDEEPQTWNAVNIAWTRIHGIGVPAVCAVQWGDSRQPWLKLSLDDVVWNVPVDLEAE